MVAEHNTGATNTSSEQAKLLITTLFQTGQVYEIRALKALLKTDNPKYSKPRTINGFFDNADISARAIQQIGDAHGIYITINPCPRECLAIANNRLVDRETKGVRDDQIAKRQWMLLDLDPERNNGITGIPANEQEHDAALALAYSIQQELSSEGWPAPLIQDSGNGTYLAYAIDLPNEDNGLVQRVLTGLAQRFNTPEVHIDQTTFNQSRIMRVAGTLNKKGDGDTERPHRYAALLSIPEVIQIVTIDQLEQVAAKEVAPQTPIQLDTRRQRNTETKERLASAKDFADRHKITILSNEQYRGGTKYKLDECPFCHESDHNVCIYDMADGRFGFSCSHSRCQGYTWTDFRDHFEPGYKDQWQEGAPGDSRKTAQSTSHQNEKSLPSNESKEKDTQDSQASVLRRIALEYIEELFRTPEGESYARIRRNGHLETLVVGGRGGKFRKWLIHLYGKECNAIPNETALSGAIAAIDAEAQFGEHKTLDVHLRIARYNGKIYLDLANEKCEVVEIDDQGWRIIDTSPVCFRHSTGMAPLPTPQRGGSIHELRKFINVKTDDDLLLLEAGIIGFFHARGPYAIINLHGERGAAKSTAARVARALIDPSIAPLRKAPPDDRTLAVLAHNNHIIAFDNLSSIPVWLSDALCRLSNGSGDSYRENYTDKDEVVFSAFRPIILNGIEEVATRGDLLDRCITVGLPAIPEEARKDEETFWQEFDERHPYLLGAILDCVSVALKNHAHTKLSYAPRTADFARWVVSCESMLTDEPGKFLKVYRANRESGIHAELEASSLARVLMFFMEHRTDWHGYMGELLNALNACADDATKTSKGWPTMSRSLSTKLSRLATSLRAVGINIEIGEHDRNGTPIDITKTQPPSGGDGVTQNLESVTQNVTQNQECDAKFSACVTSSEQILEQNDERCDASDANKYPLSYVGGRKKTEKESEEIERGGGRESSINFASLASQPIQEEVQAFYRIFTSAPGQWLHLLEDGRISIGVPEEMSDEEFRRVDAYVQQHHDEIAAILQKARMS